MKKFIKKLGKCLIIYIVLFVMLLSNVSYGYTQEEVGQAIAGYASNIASTYSSQIKYRQTSGDKYDDSDSSVHTRYDNPIWSPNEYTWNSTSEYGFDCSSFASGCYHAVTGLFSSAESTGSLVGYTSGGDFDTGTVSSVNDLVVGDIIFWNGSRKFRTCNDLCGRV